jgi:hypothetical protein
VQGVCERLHQISEDDKLPHRSRGGRLRAPAPRSSLTKFSANVLTESSKTAQDSQLCLSPESRSHLRMKQKLFEMRQETAPQVLEAQQAPVYYPVGPFTVPTQLTSTYHVLQLQPPIAHRWILDGSADARFRKATAHLPPEEQNAQHARMHAHLHDIIPLFSAQLLMVPRPPPRIRPPPPPCKPRAMPWADLDSDNDPDSPRPGHTPRPQPPTNAYQGQHVGNKASGLHKPAAEKPSSNSIGTQTCHMGSLGSSALPDMDTWNPSPHHDPHCTVNEKAGQLCTHGKMVTKGDKENHMDAFEMLVLSTEGQCLESPLRLNTFFERRFSRPLSHNSPIGAKASPEPLAHLCGAGPNLNVSGLDLRGLGFVSDDSDAEKSPVFSPSCSNGGEAQHGSWCLEHVAATLAGRQHLDPYSAVPTGHYKLKGDERTQSFVVSAGQSSSNAGLSTTSNSFLPHDSPCQSDNPHSPTSAKAPSELPNVAIYGHSTHGWASLEGKSSVLFHTLPGSPPSSTPHRQRELWPPLQACDKLQAQSNSSGSFDLAAKQTFSALSPVMAFPLSESLCPTCPYSSPPSFDLCSHQTMLPHTVSAIAADPEARRAGHLVASGQRHASPTDFLYEYGAILPQKAALAPANSVRILSAEVLDKDQRTCWHSADETVHASTMSTNSGLSPLTVPQRKACQPWICNQQAPSLQANAVSPQCTITSTSSPTSHAHSDKCIERISENLDIKSAAISPESTKSSMHGRFSASQYSAVISALQTFVEHDSGGTNFTRNWLCGVFQ